VRATKLRVYAGVERIDFGLQQPKGAAL
jgi:hypothetical protein